MVKGSIDSVQGVKLVAKPAPKTTAKVSHEPAVKYWFTQSVAQCSKAKVQSIGLISDLI
jgi:hypothetical protein